MTDLMPRISRRTLFQGSAIGLAVLAAGRAGMASAQETKEAGQPDRP